MDFNSHKSCSEEQLIKTVSKEEIFKVLEVV